MLGKRIKKIRNQNNMSLKDLSSKVNISISFLSDIENGRSLPSLKRLMDIAKGLDTTVSYLLYGTDFDKNFLFLFEEPYFDKITKKLKNLDQWSEKDLDNLSNYLKNKNKSINNKNAKNISKNKNSKS